MTVDVHPGELVAHMSEASARESVDRARTHLEAAAEEVVRQINGRAWIPLGYDSWDEMREAEYRGAAVMVPRADRPELVARLRAEGLSQRQIGDTLGVAESTVRGDIRNSADTAQPATRTDSLGRERPTTYAPRVPGLPQASPRNGGGEATANDPLPDRTAGPVVEETSSPAPSVQPPAPAIPQPSPEAQARHDREREDREMRELHSRELARCVWLLAERGRRVDAAEHEVSRWEPSQDNYPQPTTADRLRMAADFLHDLADRWPT